MGDSHHGFSVVGTTQNYFEHFRYGQAQPLAMQAGQAFNGLFDAVVGAEVAKRLGYRVGDSITLSHGVDEAKHKGIEDQHSFADHADKPFVISGILCATGTPVDRTVLISLPAMEAIHLDWQGGAKMPGFVIPPEYVSKFDLTPKHVSAVLVGLRQRTSVFRLQRWVNDYAGEPLLAVLPGLAMQQLWQVMGVAQRALLVVSGMAVAVGLTGLVAVILASLGQRRRELAILRSVGARPVDLFWLLSAEGAFVAVTGTALGVLGLWLLTVVLSPLVQVRFGLVLTPRLLSVDELGLLGAVVGVGLLASLVPGYGAYRLSLADGLVPRT